MGHPVWMEGSLVCLIDQRELPHRVSVLRLESFPEVIQAIRQMAVRGAGSIGAAGGFAMAQAALAASDSSFREEVKSAAQKISSARPTAKNLSYAVERVMNAMETTGTPEAARQQGMAEALQVEEDDVRMTQMLGQVGRSLIPAQGAVLTHCNAGWLAYPGLGSALAPVYLAHREGQPVFVYATETRPLSQGAKLTAWELSQAGVPHWVIADTAAGYMMRKGEISLVIVGADRIAANGDTANKIGTYTLALLAHAHGIPFTVAAPSPTFDADCPNGEAIPIEERNESEVLEVQAQGQTVRMANPTSHAKNPTFDVTPAKLITRFVTECGLVSPNPEEIARFLSTALRQRRAPKRTTAPAGIPPS